MPLPIAIKNFSIDDKQIECSPYLLNKIPLCSKFSLDDWHKIIADFNTDSELREYLLEYVDYVQCYVFYRKRDHLPIAFVFLFQEDDNGKVISVHGGGWYKTIECTLLYYRCFIYSIQFLLALNMKVRTACLKDNEIAERFIRSVGFVKYKETSNESLFWINESRLHNSRVYKRIFFKAKYGI